MVKQIQKQQDVVESSEDKGLLLLSFKKYNPITKPVQQFKILRNKQKINQKLVYIKNNNVQHLSKNFGQNIRPPLVKYVVGIKDKQTGEIQYVDVNNVFQMELRRPDEKPKEIQNHQIYDIQHKKKLVQEFGTVKSKRKMNQMMSNVIK